MPHLFVIWAATNWLLKNLNENKDQCDISTQSFSYPRILQVRLDQYT